MMTRDEMLFCAELSVRYHRRRASFLDVSGSLASLVTVIGGAGAFLTLLGGENTAIAKMATLSLTVVGTIQLIFRTETAAAAHKQWLKQWSRMLEEIKTHENPPPEMIANWVKERYSIEAECVTELRALQVDCFNRTTKALDLDSTQTSLRWWHRTFIQVWSFESDFS